MLFDFLIPVGAGARTLIRLPGLSEARIAFVGDLILVPIITVFAAVQFLPSRIIIVRRTNIILIAQSLQIFRDDRDSMFTAVVPHWTGAFGLERFAF